MAEREVPPPYSDVPKELPLQLQGAYVHPYTPTFEPSYMSGPSAPPYQMPPTVTTVTVAGAPGRGPHVPGSCPVCQGTSWTGTYGCLAWMLCFFCFWNCGLCCCLCMRKKKCSKCGFTIN